jgi:hypothetical protein
MTMSLQVTTHGSSADLGASFFGWFRAIRAGFKARGVADDMRGMTDRYLTDVGLDRPLLSDQWERAMAKDRLLESGWRYSQRV